ncbi:SAM-dependent methyltransferase [Massilia agri]|uniref:Class I SAM-dependent methyltransferase n=1 Tax=Massilia agri TaxID=1886785 RepID=A0ABT2AS27_9BURK|nr:class I SAM-dependent methyltransferase [Massilia agri]MCS0599054.1 class I SAM-dependent methyltransferase [Massilia agri]
MQADPRRRTLLLSAAATAGLSVLPARLLSAQELVEPSRLDVPYVPTPQEVVDRMLAMGKVGKNDVLYDLGCGDGRIVVTAAKVHAARGTGIDLNPVRIAEAKENAKKAGVTDRTTFKVGDLFEADISPATVVTLYLLPTINVKLRPRLWQQLKVGTRVVSHAFDMGPEWPPEKKDEVEGRTIYQWTITQANKRAVKA